MNKETKSLEDILNWLDTQDDQIFIGQDDCPDDYMDLAESLSEYEDSESYYFGERAS